jgi:hypothetical protein
MRKYDTYVPAIAQWHNLIPPLYRIDAATSSGILKAKQKLDVTFNSDKLGGIDFTKFYL